MAKTFRLHREEPILNIVSYGSSTLHENGPRLTPGQVAQVRRTVERAPEVMVKVLPRSSSDLNVAGKHLDYISRHGTLPLEMDGGEDLEGRKGMAVLDEWDLDIDDLRRQGSLAAVNGRKPPKLVHKLMFSMPAGTPPDKVLAAVRNFAREQFWGQHRNAFVLHTDEDHPHVHLVLKAVSEQGVRLNIKKATLRVWRSEFAQNLRLLGISANATERAVRGQDHKAKKDGIFRADSRGDSSYVRAQAEAVASELLKGEIHIDRGKRTLVETRKQVVRGWAQVATALKNDGELVLADQVRSFAAGFSPPRTDRELVARELILKVRAARTSNREMVR
ncbi:MAG: relaxase/mobilization nuclease domain-containing protein [Steroidobacteraceae bacterium]